MPEIKNNFLEGKMNKDLDERVIPKGQYRNAENIELSTAEGASVGTIRNILGNKRIEDIIPNNFVCVGSIADEKTNKLYWFISTYEKDAIIEYDITQDVVTPVFVDLNASNSKAVLRFGATPIITGINIIDDLLLWTDNLTEPKKINISECKKGTTDFDTHTQLLFELGSFHGITIENVSNNLELNDFLTHRPLKGKYFWFNSKQLHRMLGLSDTIPDYNFQNNLVIDGSRPFIRHYRDGKFLQRHSIAIENHSANGTRAYYYSSTGYTNAMDTDAFVVGDVIYADNVTIDIEERHITVIKPKPLSSPRVKINHSFGLNTARSVDELFSSPSTKNLPNLFETKFPRFAYRYKYRDGEFSSFSPFTEVVFNPLYPKDKNNSIETDVFFGVDNVYDVKDPSNKAMTNSIHSIELTDFIEANTPEDVIEIDILYKQEDSSVIYSIDTIKHNDPRWHLPGNTEGYNLGYNKVRDANTGIVNNYSAVGAHSQGKYVVTTENIYAALPADQLLRPWDNVPRRALAQEVTGNRVVYGNYLQNYNVYPDKPVIKTAYDDRNNSIGTFGSQGLPSIKSQRNYQLGVVFCDEYGRETPVFTSEQGALNIPWENSSGVKNASRSLQLNANVKANFPEWVDSMKFFVKETSNEYYNLMMERAWVTSTTYELDNSEGHIWISFPSSDRNKVSEEDYIILKKKVGIGEKQVPHDNKFKIIDIKNEAPDAIKYKLVNYGVSTNSSNKLTDDLFTDVDYRIDISGSDTISLEFENWKLDSVVKGLPLDVGDDAIQTLLLTKNLHISWARLNTAGSQFAAYSKKYRVTGGRKGTTHYVLKLQDKITTIDADLAHENSNSSETTRPNKLHADLIVQFERKELKDTEDFSGKFFVKISKNQITDIIQKGRSTVPTIESYQVAARQPTFHFRDDIAAIDVLNYSASTSGLTNYNGYMTQSFSTANNIQSPANNAIGGASANSTYYASATLRLTDFAVAWDGIKAKHGSTFFIDGMHMASGQSEASDYAKYNCVTWSGAAPTLSYDSAATQLEFHPNPSDSSWSYPPLKTWITDFEQSAEMLESFSVTDEAPVAYLGGTGPTGLYYDNKLLSTSVLIDDDKDWNNEKVDGWIGHPQQVKRVDFKGYGSTSKKQETLRHHVNGLEGLVTTTPTHSIGPRRWFSGITSNSTEYGVGVDTKTYSHDKETGKHFIHLSFFAPGEDLHDGVAPTSDYTLFGDDAISGQLQGIWGGGHFTGPLISSSYGTGSAGEKHFHVCMETNNDSATNNFLPATPGPGVGLGYDLNYQEQHQRQWDPTFPSDPENKIRDFIRNIHAGAQFKFLNPKKQAATAKTVYTIKSVSVKKIYNHTSWRRAYNRYASDALSYFETTADMLAVHRSVEETAITWLNNLGSDGTGSGADYASALLAFRTKIKHFGKASNRRLCYIIEIDKDPDAAGNYNPLDKSANSEDMTADVAAANFCNIEFLEKVESIFLSDLNKFPAIWETSPAKQEVDLDIYYEVSDNIPVRLNSRTNELFAPIGCKVELLNTTSPYVNALTSQNTNTAFFDVQDTSVSHLTEWNDNVATLEPGFSLWDGVNEINYSGVSFKFTRKDGSFTIAKAGVNGLVGATSSSDTKQDFLFQEDVGENIRVGLAWNNCYSFGNGLESNRIKDDFNEVFIRNGVKASTTTQKTYEEERRSTGMIYSGLYNSQAGVNDLNQFIMAEKITKDLNPTFGSIQKLFQRRISLIAFCEDRVVSITSNKDAIYNADGNPQLIASDSVLGDANPFEGNYGISKNPESFASESYRVYFADKQRGAVLRLSKDGITPISSSGMHDWFRDNLPRYSSLIGTYDSYKEDYNLSLSYKFGENIIFNSYLESEGIEALTETGSLVNILENSRIFDGSNYQVPYEAADILTANNYTWGSNNFDLNATLSITNRPAIQVGELQPYVPYDAGQVAFAGTAEVLFDPGQPYIEYQAGQSFIAETLYQPAQQAVLYQAEIPGQPFIQYLPEVLGQPYIAPVAEIAYVEPVFTSQGGTNTQADGSGRFYAPNFQTPTNPAVQGHSNGVYAFTTGDNLLFGPSAINDADPGLYGKVRRQYYAVDGNANGTSTLVNSESTQDSAPGYQSAVGPSNMVNITGNALVINNVGVWMGQDPYPTRNVLQNYENGNILFNRPYMPTDSHDVYAEFRDMGATVYNYAHLEGHLLDTYNATMSSNHKHSSIFAGDEIEIKVVVKVLGSPYEGTGVDGYLPNSTAGGADPLSSAGNGRPNNENMSGGAVTNWGSKVSYNLIEPFIQLHDGANGEISSDFIHTGNGSSTTSPQTADHTSQPTTGPLSINNNGVSKMYYWQNYLAPNTPTTGFTSEELDAGADMIQNPSNASGIDYNCHFNPSSSTASVNLLPHFDNSCTLGNPTYKTWELTFRYKFKQAGFIQPPSYGSINIGYGTQFADTKVVEDLRIRVGQSKKNATTGAYSSMYGGHQGGGVQYPTECHNQKWEIESFEVIKLQGIESPDIEYVDAIAGQNLILYQAEQAGQIFIAYAAEILGSDFVPMTPYDPGQAYIAYNPGQSFIAETPYQYAVPPALFIQEVAEVLAVPDVVVPGWVQVSHYGTAGWSLAGTAASSNNTYFTAQKHSNYGATHSAVMNYGYSQATSVIEPSTSINSTLISYVTPGVFAAHNTVSDFGGIPFTNLSGGGIVDNVPFDINFDGGVYCFQPNANGSPTYADLKVDISADPFVANSWYLIDIEYDCYTSDFGNGAGVNGSIHVVGVGYVNSSADLNQPLSDFGLGLASGSVSKTNCQLLPAVSAEYGDPQTNVLRAIFQVNANSWVNHNSYPDRKNELILRLWDRTDQQPGIITKIITKKIDYKPQTGTAVGWSKAQSSPVNLNHSLDKRSLYYLGQSICWEGITRDGDWAWWKQDFLTGNGPFNSSEGWTFKFKVSNNPRSQTFNGTLTFALSTDIITDAAHAQVGLITGIYFEVDSIGDYEVNFNWDEDTSADWTITKDGTAYNGVFQPLSNINATLVAQLEADGMYLKNCLQIYDTANQSSMAASNSSSQQSCDAAVSQLSLVDKALIIRGGSAGSWQWTGFDQSLVNYITYSSTVNNVITERISFEGCPLVDPVSSLAQTVVIKAIQHLDVPVKRFEEYIVTVDHGVTTGALSIYYFNAAGFGFRVLDLNSSNQGTVVTNVKIGDYEWSSINPTNNTYEPELKETFVILPQDAGVDVNGWIDNITMVKNFARQLNEEGNSVFEEKTISFSEKANGWTSFKSFVPEGGVSLSKKYFTFKDGGLFQHYMPLAYVDDEWVSSTPNLAQNYNIYYNIDSYTSSISTVLNDEPSMVKRFNTINYEGSQSQVILPSSENFVSLNNIMAWNSGSDIPGWACTEMLTDLEAGSLAEFIKKENKWFGNINGAPRFSELDTTRFSVQGIGNATEVEPFAFTGGDTPPPADYVPPAPEPSAYNLPAGSTVLPSATAIY